jgi:two-component system, cell cycle response regulator
MTARVLVVDDIEINVKLLEAKLSSEYYDVLTAFNGPAALRVAETEMPDVVLLDVMMPHMDGFEVCRRLKANPRTADLPVVMVTALSDTASRLTGLEAGADDFLTKPVNDIALFARVRSLVRLKRMTEEWRLRDKICGQFGSQDAGGIAADSAPARILLLEEDDFAAARMSEALAPIANELVRASTCAAAHDLLDEDTELLIASLSVPDGDTLRLLSQCRATETYRQLPILLIADAADLPRLAKGLDLGANDYLVRPLDRSELVARSSSQIRRKRMHERLRENQRRSLSLALTDELTGLYNRRFVLAHLSELVERTYEGSSKTAILLFDIDHFKHVNDTWGHAAGDDVLREIALRTMDSLRSSDLVARFGGEEFLVVMPETSLAVATAVAERLRLKIAREPFMLRSAGEKVPLTISVGVTSTEESRDDVDRLLKRADDALYTAKKTGRNRVIVAAPDDARLPVGS